MAYNEDQFKSKLRDAINLINISVLMDSYALENVVIGRILPNESIDFDKYVSDLQLQNLNPYLYKNKISGMTLTRDGKIADKNIDTFFMDFFSYQIETIFEKAIQMSPLYDNIENLPFEPTLRDYFMLVFQIFRDIAKTNVYYEDYKLLPITNIPIKGKYKGSLIKLITDIKFNKIKYNACVKII